MKRRAFTLIELMVVLAMIMILVGAMTASINAARRRAKIAKAMNAEEKGAAKGETTK